MSKGYSTIDVIACVQGNTARSVDPISVCGRQDKCVVYDFKSAAEVASPFEEDRESRRKSLRRKSLRRKAARARARKVAVLRTAFAAFLLMAVIFGIGGIASRAESKEVAKAYKYYDTITVAYQENLLDIVERYDDRNYYETQNDYLEELCRINNLPYDKSSYPVVTPGTHLVVPYYSTELK